MSHQIIMSQNGKSCDIESHLQQMVSRECHTGHVTAHNEGERQSYINGINTTIYYQKNSHNHMTG